MESPSYSFNEKDFPKITLHLVIQVLSYQQALTDAILDEINDEEKANRIVARINEIMPDKKEQIIEQVYAAFGSTPDV